MNLLPLPGGRGFLGLTDCPGWHAALAPTATSRAALHRDLGAIADAGATMLVTLIAAEELGRIGAEPLRQACADLRLAWAHCPITDMQVPLEPFEHAWAYVGPEVHRRLDRGETVALHCRAGLGRTGTIAARILIERGTETGAAIALVRRYRPGAIETPEQEAWVRALPQRRRADVLARSGA